MFGKKKDPAKEASEKRRATIRQHYRDEVSALGSSGTHFENTPNGGRRIVRGPEATQQGQGEYIPSPREAASALGGYAAGRVQEGAMRDALSRAKAEGYQQAAETMGARNGNGGNGNGNHHER